MASTTWPRLPEACQLEVLGRAPFADLKVSCPQVCKAWRGLVAAKALWKLREDRGYVEACLVYVDGWARQWGVGSWEGPGAEGCFLYGGVLPRGDAGPLAATRRRAAPRPDLGAVTRGVACGSVVAVVAETPYADAAGSSKALAAYSPAADAWRTVPLPDERRDEGRGLPPRMGSELRRAALFYAAGKLFLVGGEGRGDWDDDDEAYRPAPLRRVDAWDPDTNTWERLPDLPCACWMGRADGAAIGSKIYVVGAETYTREDELAWDAGDDDGGRLRCLLLVYDVSARTWVIGPDPPRPPNGDVAVLVRGGRVEVRPSQGFEIPASDIGSDSDAPECDYDVSYAFDVVADRWVGGPDPAAFPPPHMRREGVGELGGAFFAYGPVWREGRATPSPPYEQVWFPGATARDYRAFALRDGDWAEKALPGGWPGRHVFVARLG